MVRILSSSDPQPAEIQYYVKICVKLTTSDNLEYGLL